MMFNSRVYRHGLKAERKGFDFNDGDTVTVEWRPMEAALHYFMVGSDEHYRLVIDRRHLKLGPLCFVVGVREADVSQLID